MICKLEINNGTWLGALAVIWFDKHALGHALCHIKRRFKRASAARVPPLPVPTRPSGALVERQEIDAEVFDLKFRIPSFVFHMTFF